MTFIEKTRGKAGKLGSQANMNIYKVEHKGWDFKDDMKLLKECISSHIIFFKSKLNDLEMKETNLEYQGTLNVGIQIQ